MWTCSKCETVNWDSAVSCRKCHASGLESQIGPSTATPVSVFGFSKPTGLRTPRDALVEVTNALAIAVSVTEVTVDFMRSVCIKYKVDLYKQFKDELPRLYGAFIAYCLRDRSLADKDVDAIWHLKALFAISDTLHNTIFRDVAVTVYRQTLVSVLADCDVSAKEKTILDKLAIDLELPEDITKRLYYEEVGKRLQSKMDEALADKMLSPDEEKELALCAKQLGGVVSYGAASQADLERYRRMWRIQCGKLPVEGNLGINLPRGEDCYWTRAVSWLEMRKVKHGFAYAGPTMRVKIATGLYYRMGVMNVAPLATNEMTRVDGGTAYITNRRLLFVGRTKNASIRLDKILDVVPCSDGVKIYKESGKPPVLGFKGDIDICCAVLARAISEFA